ncbi:hypothetical protein L211DRAFT_853319 [Terfezia boudieri ATCC MYA-4762]|uniref:DUF6532 domain-containing protein n=1 Tax=Terfezia boudieri ATCC MYA-4762 TaxID=1051890 RepID=A0A3N4LCT1_9PEZI|nr:hypothetical protein L211DRAFT_853319 [Terfezia boudieri ATCC MYA-4762]
MRVFAESHEGIQSPKLRMKGARQRAPRNRSFTQFDGITKVVVTIAAKRIERSWMRSHLVYEAKHHIARLYGFDQNCSPEYIRKHVSWLLDKDRFTCQREKRVHALQTYKTGMFKDREFFNYEKAGVDFNRMLDQWNLLTTTMEQTLLKIIRLEIGKLCELQGKVVRWQRAEAYGVGPRELAQYAEELAVDLKKAEKGSLIPLGYFNEGSPTEPDESAIPDNISTGLPTMLDDEDVEDVEDDEDDEDDEPEGELGDNDEDNYEVPTENDDGGQSGDSDDNEV